MASRFWYCQNSASIRGLVLSKGWLHPGHGTITSQASSWAWYYHMAGMHPGSSIIKKSNRWYYKPGSIRDLAASRVWYQYKSGSIQDLILSLNLAASTVRYHHKAGSIKSLILLLNIVTSRVLYYHISSIVQGLKLSQVWQLPESDFIKSSSIQDLVPSHVWHHPGTNTTTSPAVFSVRHYHTTGRIQGLVPHKSGSYQDLVLPQV